MSEHASESQHWYKQDGTPCYTVTKKTGGERPATLRDARTMNLVPSVTQIIKLAAAPGLINWIIDQTIMAALTLPRIEGETSDEFIARVKADSKEQATKAAERGTQIHAYIQEGFSPVDFTGLCAEGVPFYASVRDTLDRECSPRNWKAEESFAWNGYGGKVDLHCEDIVCDFKTTDKPIADLKTWPEHSYQLSAYRNGLGLPEAKCGIVYVNSQSAESRLIWIPEAELQKGWRCFLALKELFYAKTGLVVGTPV